VKKASEYRQHATQCLFLAKQVGDEHRNQLLAMAAAWENLALEREKSVKNTAEAKTISEG
jgi:hypothetical protein